MEVIPVSPSPASSTEGDNLCETDVTNVAIHSVTLLICLCGLAGNGTVLCLYSLQSRTYAIFHLAVADFLFLLFTVPSALLLLVEDLSCSPILPLMYLSFIFQLSMVSYYWGLFRLMASSFDRDMNKLWTLCCRGNFPERLLLVVDMVQSWVFFVLFTVIPMLTFLCPSHEQGQCRAALISVYAIILLLFVAPVVITRTNDITKAKRGSRKQQFKWRHIIVFIIVLLTLLLIFCNILQQLGYLHVSFEVFFLLTCIHSSIKPFIYFLAGRCWSPCSMDSLRLSLHRVFVEKEENTASRDDDNTDTVI
ncbi:mas-related G-protein coupled receptor member F-like [Catharus ustulatus]|uniref:mas-related G-protein coupled receptor member F-like n=1 Tax=Catharus ustulatus TaxID=91951 RepID=UPI00140A8E81|nr:mas-related G-protein coupled receptor member F-like [Catharus ustulatus]